jgi:multicomponent Na+:H+ antiporter subunit F
MTDFLACAAVFVLAMAAIGLLRIVRGPSGADRIMAAQLAGTAGAASVLLIAAGSGSPPVANVAMILALLAAFASVAFVRGIDDTPTGAGEGAER